MLCSAGGWQGDHPRGMKGETERMRLPGIAVRAGMMVLVQQDFWIRISGLLKMYAIGEILLGVGEKRTPFVVGVLPLMDRKQIIEVMLW